MERMMRLAAILLLSIFVASCKDDATEYKPQPEKVQVTLSAGIKTRAVDATWVEGDCIGLSMFKTGTTTFLDNQHNHRYSTRAGDGVFNADGSNVVYYPLDGSLVDIRGYYPHRGDLGEDCLYSLDVADQSDLAAINFMTFDCYTGASRNNPNITVTFKHRLTKLIFNLRREDNSAVTIKNVSVSGMNTKGSFCLLKEQLTIETDSKNNLEVPVKDNCAQAIVMPREAGEGIVFTITSDDNVEYIVKLDPEQELKAGFKYTFNVLLRGGETPAVIKGIIQDWTDGGSIDIGSRPVTIVPDPEASIGFVPTDKIKLYWENLEVMEYTYDGTQWIPESPVYWENIGDGISETVMLLAEYIRQDAMNNSQLPELFLAETSCQRFGAVSLNFKLVPAKIVFQLKSQGEPEEIFSETELEKATIELPDYLKGYKLENGVFTADGSKGNITVKNNMALVIEQTKVNDLAIITLNGNPYKISKPEGQVFLAGKVYTFKVNILKSGVERFSASFKDWTPHESDNNFTVFAVKTPGETTMFEDNDKLTLYYGIESGTKVKLGDFVYNKVGEKWNTTPAVYWEDLDRLDKYNFYAISTLKSAPEHSNQMDDVMYAEHTGISRFGAVELKFTKKTARIVVTLKSTDNSFTPRELEEAIITMPGYKIGAKYDGLACTSGTITGDIITLNYSGSEPVLWWNALIEPQSVPANGVMFNIHIKGNDYPVNALKTVKAFDVAMEYTFKIDISKAWLDFTTSYEPWRPANEDDDDINIGLE